MDITTISEGVDEGIMNPNLENPECVINLASLLSPDVPSDAEVVVTAADTTICPPQLALDVIEQSLTPRKRNAFAKSMHKT